MRRKDRLQPIAYGAFLALSVAVIVISLPKPPAVGFAHRLQASAPSPA